MPPVHVHVPSGQRQSMEYPVLPQVPCSAASQLVPPLLPLLEVGVQVIVASPPDPLPVPELLVTPDEDAPPDASVLPLPDEPPLLR